MPSLDQNMACQWVDFSFLSLWIQFQRLDNLVLQGVDVPRDLAYSRLL
jgi:hypothetical protein